MLAAGGAFVFFCLIHKRRHGETESRSIRRELFTRGRNSWEMCSAFFCFDYYWYLLLNWLPDYLINVRGFGIMKAGLLASLPFLVFGLGQPLGAGSATV